LFGVKKKNNKPIYYIVIFKEDKIMELNKKLELLEEIMELDEGELSPDMKLEDLEEWDSLTKLALMAAIRKLMSKTISVDELKAFKTVQDVCDYLE
jgi:acyl carrier protein